MGFHDIKKQLLYCLVQQIPSPKIQVGTLWTILYKFNTKIGRHPAMPFIVMHFKKIKFQRYFLLFRSLSNPYDTSFSQKQFMPLSWDNCFSKNLTSWMFGKALNRTVKCFFTIVNAIYNRCQKQSYSKGTYLFSQY